MIIHNICMYIYIYIHNYISLHSMQHKDVYILHRYALSGSALDGWDDPHCQALADLMLEVDGNGDGFIDFKVPIWQGAWQ